jgi:hypothetical protein
MFVVDPPSPHLFIEDDRDRGTFTALVLHFESAAQAPIRAGWHSAEVVPAMVNWALAHTPKGAGVDNDATDTRGSAAKLGRPSWDLGVATARLHA